MFHISFIIHYFSVIFPLTKPSATPAASPFLSSSLFSHQCVLSFLLTDAGYLAGPGLEATRNRQKVKGKENSFSHMSDDLKSFQCVYWLEVVSYRKVELSVVDLIGTTKINDRPETGPYIQQHSEFAEPHEVSQRENDWFASCQDVLMIADHVLDLPLTHLYYNKIKDNINLRNNNYDKQFRTLKVMTQKFSFCDKNNYNFGYNTFDFESPNNFNNDRFKLLFKSKGSRVHIFMRRGAFGSKETKLLLKYQSERFILIIRLFQLNPYKHCLSLL